MSRLVAFSLYDAFGSPLTTAAPVFTVYKGYDGVSRTPPTLSHIGGGIYGCEISTTDATDGVAFLITSGGTAAPAYLAGAEGGRVQAFALYDLSTGIPTAGQSPTFVSYVDASGSSLSQPTISDFGSGLYAFVPPAYQFKTGVAFDIDCGAGVNPPRFGGFAQEPSGPAQGIPVLPSLSVPLPTQAASVDAYARQLQYLFPPGLLWKFEPDSELSRTVLALAGEFARVDERSDTLIEESDPRTALETLSDWEAMLGLPDACVSTVPTAIVDRRQAITSKYTARGGQSRQYFIDLAASLGFPVTITEFTVTTCTADCTSSVTGADWAFAWQVNVPGTAPAQNYATTLSTCDANLGGFMSSALECIISRSAPPHTTVVFSYS